MTKEELQKKIELFDKVVEETKKRDLDHRKEFAKAFNWYDVETNRYSSLSTKTLREPSWGEILVQVGKLLQRGTSLDLTEEIAENKRVIQDLHTRVSILSNE